jgi:hypothetical protein
MYVFFSDIDAITKCSQASATIYENFPRAFTSCTAGFFTCNQRDKNAHSFSQPAHQQPACTVIHIHKKEQRAERFSVCVCRGSKRAPPS